ncbi:ATP-binding protein [Pseudomonas syringae]|uniref:ATP-binding protein n=1 Tax=Pseudomonas syringae TaxID=317 RepID=UPI003F752F49
MKKPKSLKFRPYARLLTMLGDQLIKSERVALVELIKNAYDADARWVKVTFQGFDADFHANSNSKIIIEDDGHGMTQDIIENHWANPATPVKLMDKKNSKKVTAKGRVIQGEKGIGRFALLKIGRKITITTRCPRTANEQILKLDVSNYTSDFISDDRALFLEELSLTLQDVNPAETIKPGSIQLGVSKTRRKSHGTRIEIAHLVGAWTRDKVAKVYEDLTRLQSIFEVRPEEASNKTDLENVFEVFIYRDSTYEAFSAERREKLDLLLENNAVFKIEGEYDESGQLFDFTLNGKRERIKLRDPRLSALAVFRQQFGKKGEVLEERGTECGSFGFSFYVFNFSPEAKGATLLDAEDKKLIKEHRIYLYRDNIRVYPYGDPDDDWLQIDVRRGTVRASEFLSNDQVVGFVNITQENNPDLRDKTSREGLVDTGHPTEDFRALLQTFLAWVRKDPYAKQLIKEKRTTDIAIFKGNEVQRSFDEAVVAAETGSKNETVEKIAKANQNYKTERRYLVQRAETTEHLAGVGLSVEAASHDLMLAMQSATRTLDALITSTNRGGDVDPELLQRELSSVRGLLSFIESQMKNMQLLFKSTKQRRKIIRVGDILDKVIGLFKGMLDSSQISVSVEKIGSPLAASTTEAVLLQLFLNLFDNAVFWVSSSDKPRAIEIHLDGDRGVLIFSDSGPGFRSDDLPYIFEPFFSGKGDEGRGLGLYIARQLLERHEYSIDVAERHDRIQRGANLVISFVKEDEE